MLADFRIAFVFTIAFTVGCAFSDLYHLGFLLAAFLPFLGGIVFLLLILGFRRL